MDAYERPSIDAEKIWTVKRLRSIRPGETIVYYRGQDLERDIAHDTPSYNSPHHAAVLRVVANTAVWLERQGRVSLARRLVNFNGVDLIECVATGRGSTEP